MDAASLFNNGQWLPLVFAFLMGLAILVYVLLDGYDLGVGMLMTRAEEADRDTMIASIGPFWDANETWLVLGAGLLLTAFPMAHGIVLQALYLPVALMLFGLIVRGVSFDFRAKAMAEHKGRWDTLFSLGSLITALAQGYMLGLYIMGFTRNTENMLFSALVGVCVAAGYTLLGACWLILKTEGSLQRRAVKWAKRFLKWTTLGLGVVSLATPLANEAIFAKWFQLPQMLLLAPIPLATLMLIGLLYVLLRRMPEADDRHAWVPLAGAAGIFLLAFLGLAYSFFPYIVPGAMTIWQAAAAPESLKIMLVGAVIVVPCILGYTFFSYRVFRGKVRALHY